MRIVSDYGSVISHWTGSAMLPHRSAAKLASMQTTSCAELSDLPSKQAEIRKDFGFQPIGFSLNKFLEI